MENSSSCPWSNTDDTRMRAEAGAFDEPLDTNGPVSVLSTVVCTSTKGGYALPPPRHPQGPGGGETPNVPSH
eukprot:6358858-Amphidinium_carterae.1